MNAQWSCHPWRRKLATVLAACGALTTSSGLALVVSTGPAHAEAAKICHANDNDVSPYTWSAKPSKDDGGHTWHSDGWWHGVFHTTGQTKPDYSPDNDPAVTQDWCVAKGVVLVGTVSASAVSASVDWDSVPASCETDGVSTWTVVPADHVTYGEQGGTVPTAGGTATVTVTADEGYAFADDTGSTTGTTSLTLTHQFTAFDLTQCGDDTGGTTQPIAVTPQVSFTDPTCDGVDAGWTPTAMDGVTYGLAGTVGPGESVTVTATLAEGYQLGDGARASFEHTFADPQCQQDPGNGDSGTTDPGTTDPGTTDPGTTDPGTQDPGTVAPGHHVKHHVPQHHASQDHATHARAAARHAASAQGVVTPTVVHAGLAGLPTPQQGTDVQLIGTALSSGGALVLLGAGWLGLGLRRRDAHTS